MVTETDVSGNSYEIDQRLYYKHNYTAIHSLTQAFTSSTSSSA